MKAIIKIKMLADIERPRVIDKGEWIDLRCAEDTEVSRTKVTNIPLGVAMKLPDGYEAVVVSRSSTAKNFGIYNPNALGIIDNSYSGDADEWKYPAITVRHINESIYKNDRICQFRIQLSQKATMWQRIKWLFTSGVKLEFVESLGGKSRGGFGSTGKR